MLTQISVKNLGCFDEKPCEVNFTEETLIAGPNNSGKSMLFAGLNLARMWLVSGGHLQWNTGLFMLHDILAAINSHDENKTIEVSFTLKEKNAPEHVFCFVIEGKKSAMMTLNKQSIRTQPIYQEMVKKIWCLRPNRSLVPFGSTVAGARGSATTFQPLNPDGSNVINFLLERWTDRDKKWGVAEEWLRKIDPDMSELKTPIRGGLVYLETTFGETSVNVSLQGSGFQSAAAIISAVVFSPEGSTIIIEEPEAFLHPKSQEVIIDMINDAVNNYGKQIIFTTHSCNILLPIWHDVGKPRHRRDEGHVRVDPSKFSMWTFEKAAGKVSAKPYPIREKTWQNFSEDFKLLWG